MSEREAPEVRWPISGASKVRDCAGIGAEAKATTSSSNKKKKISYQMIRNRNRI